MDQRIIQILSDSFTQLLIPGICVTIPLTLISFAIGLVVAVAIALIRTAKTPVLEPLARIYVWIFRGTPALVQLFVIFFGLPSIGIVIDAFPSAVIAFSLNVGAYASEALRAAIGAVPAMMGALRYNTYVIANADEEFLINRVLVRPDSPIAKVKGWNKDYPEVLGSPETVKGKTFLTTTVSSAHYALSVWLRVLGLTEKDIVLKNMDQAQALSAYEDGIGDGVCLWAPHAYVGEAKGWKLVANPKLCGRSSPCVIVADRKYADANPEVTARFLSVYMRAMNMLQNEPLESLVPEYRRFFLEWAGRDYPADLALLDLQTHPVFNLDEQLAMFDASKGQSEAQYAQSEMARFFAEIGSINKDELKRVEDGSYATDKFLKLIKKPIPSYK